MLMMMMHRQMIFGMHNNGVVWLSRNMTGVDSGKENDNILQFENSRKFNELCGHEGKEGKYTKIWSTKVDK